MMRVGETKRNKEARVKGTGKAHVRRVSCKTETLQALVQRYRHKVAGGGQALP